ncbi:TatD family hydrolase [Motilimonas eburnea]|uniref:TatD family hydrolase n=1 Tax=Motilimonas eburnea TaxID=1737488 RepID=UPI001E390627|nr:TatD family hydrolase [Motilimonas eburnea]
MSAFMDSHCHLDFAQFDTCREQEIAKALALGVQKIMVPGVKAATWPALITLCKQQPQLDYALGLHPYFLADFQQAHLGQLDRRLTEERPAALGEIGLDACVDIPMALQLFVFRAQIALARKHQLPLILHQRKTASNLLAELKSFPYGGVLHAFSGSYEMAMAFIDKGFKLGIGGVITYERAAKTRATLARVPLEALVLETDAPDMPLANQTGGVNTPQNIPLIFDALCQLRPEPAEQIKQVIWQTSQSLFQR